MRERRVKESVVSIARSSNEQISIEDALSMLPMNSVIHKGDLVVITPNWITAKPPSSACVVGPYTLQSLIQYIRRFEPREIVVATGSGGGETFDIFHKVGYDKILDEEKIRFVDLNYGPYTELKLDHEIIPKTKVNELLDQIDVLISFTQLKQHEEATISASIKNIALGWPPAEIHGFPKKKTGIHDDLHGFIAAMAKAIPIDLAIVSVDKAMIGTGPSEGIAVDTEGLMIASTDPVAADAIGARLLGYLPQAVHYLYMLYKNQVGEADPQKMQINGIDLIEAERIFSKAAYGVEIAVDNKGKIKGIHAE